MQALVGVALSLLLAEPHNGSNGFDPTSMYVLKNLVDDYRVAPSSQEFRDWLAVDRAQRAKAVAYFVACAFDDKTVIRFDAEYTWRGRLDLAPVMRANLAQRAPVVPDKNSRERGANLLLPSDEGKWVSACLMAHANLARSHEYILLRGNPPTWTMGPTAAELWTMGYPEGVFFADLLNFNTVEAAGRVSTRAGPRSAPTKPQLEKSFTLSLNLPEIYGGVAVDKWAPPNASNGRTLDFAGESSATVPGIGPYRVAEKLGTYLANQLLFPKEVTQTDPPYNPRVVCVAPRQAGGGGGVTPTGASYVATNAVPAVPHVQTPPTLIGAGIHHQVVDCSEPGAEHLRPLFVHAPRVVGLATAQANAINPSLPIQAIDTGTQPLSERRPCKPVVECTGPFRIPVVGQPPAAPTDLKSQTLVGPGEKQSVVVVLRHGVQERIDLLGIQKERFTAIVRYRTRDDAAAQIEVSDENGAMRLAPATWKGLPEKTATTWQWMQVYPVYAVPDAETSGGKIALKIRISGLAGPGHPPELDIAGFVSGPPWCVDDLTKPFADVCTDRPDRVSMLRRRGAQAAVTPR